MSTKKHRPTGKDKTEAAAVGEANTEPAAVDPVATSSSVASPVPVEAAPGGRCFLVRCVDPLLSGYKVRGVAIPRGGSATIHVSAKHTRDVLADRALVVEEVTE